MLFRLISLLIVSFLEKLLLPYRAFIIIIIIKIRTLGESSSEQRRSASGTGHPFL